MSLKPAKQECYFSHFVDEAVAKQRGGITPLGNPASELAAEPRFRPDSVVLDPALLLPLCCSGCVEQGSRKFCGGRGRAAAAEGLGEPGPGVPGSVGRTEPAAPPLPQAEKSNSALDSGGGPQKRLRSPQPRPSKFNMSSSDKYSLGETRVNERLLEAAGQLTIMGVLGFLLETQTAHSLAEIVGWRNRASSDGNTRPGRAKQDRNRPELPHEGSPSALGRRTGLAPRCPRGRVTWGGPAFVPRKRAAVCLPGASSCDGWASSPHPGQGHTGVRRGRGARSPAPSVHTRAPSLTDTRGTHPLTCTRRRAARTCPSGHTDGRSRRNARRRGPGCHAHAVLPADRRNRGDVGTGSACPYRCTRPRERLQAGPRHTSTRACTQSRTHARVQARTHTSTRS